MLPTPFAEQVLDLVAGIPAGWVLTYGDVAERLDSRGARAVGAALARYGPGVPWWRVVRASGAMPLGHEDDAAQRLRAEGVTLRAAPDGWRVDLSRHRWPGERAGRPDE